MDWIKILGFIIGIPLGLIVGLLIIFGIGWGIDQIQHSGFQEMYDACDEYCFHSADNWGADTTGMTWNNECICADGSIGWFK